MIHVVFEYNNDHPTHAGIRTRTCFPNQLALDAFLVGGYLIKAQEKIIYQGENEDEAARLIHEKIGLSLDRHFQDQLDMIAGADLPLEDMADMLKSLVHTQAFLASEINDSRNTEQT